MGVNDVINRDKPGDFSPQGPKSWDLAIGLWILWPKEELQRRDVQLAEDRRLREQQVWDIWDGDGHP